VQQKKRLKRFFSNINNILLTLSFSNRILKKVVALFYRKLQHFVCTLVKWLIGYRYREIDKKAGNCMKEPRRFKEAMYKKTSSIKTLLLLVAIALVAGLFIWLQIQPDPTQETIEKDPIV
jgi:hypothetical protein